MLSVLWSACQPSDSPLFTKVASDASQLRFTNRVIETDTVNLAYNYYFYNGAGVTICDFNNDGREDIFMVGNHVPSRLYLNEGNLTFRDVSEAAGLLNDYWASGATFVDINGDYLQDIFICTVGKQEPNLLYINQGIDPSGIPTFVEQAEAYGLADRIISTQAAFLDFDRDNDLDLFVAVNSQLMNNRNETRARNQKSSNDTQDRFYRNNGDDTFTEVSEEVGIVNEGYSLGLAVNDINNDGWPDIYVANDFISNDLVYMNNRQGGFEERGAAYLRHTSYNGMGVDIADVNHDGLMDITVVDMLPRSNRRRKLMMSPLNYDLYEYRLELGYLPQHVKNTLQLNQGLDESGHIQFSEIGTLAGMYSTDWSWAPLWADFDNSGTRDLFVTNGYHKDLTDLDFSNGLKENLKFGSEAYSHAYQLETMAQLRSIKAANFLYKNSGEMVLQDVSHASGVAEPSFSHGAAYADLDDDGDVELLINNLGHEAFLYQNNTLPQSSEKTTNHYIKIKLEGPDKNTNAIGARVSLFYDSVQQTHYHSPVRGYLSSMSQRIHFGLGTTTVVDSVTIYWPDGTYQRLEDVVADQEITIAYQPSRPVKNRPPQQRYAFTEVADLLGLHYHHTENRFADFKNDPLLLKMYSREGPALAVGDVNGDGKEDMVVGGATGHPATLFIQQDGTFTKQPVWEEDSAYEDLGILLFDADNDHDLDAYVVSGGTEHPAQSSWYEDRLYLNTGQRFVAQGFVRSPRLPKVASSGGTVRGADFDRDGDIDLLIGGKVSPGRYPEAPTTQLLVNEKGIFTDQAPASLREVGMVSDALWTDFNGDQWPDLIVVGEWMPITFFVNEQGTLKPYTNRTSLENTSGWWNSLTAGDYDHDGDIDYVVGNFGLNSYITASPEQPIRLYAGDVNEDGAIDPILSYYAEDDEGNRQEFPVHPRDALIDQVLGYKKRFQDYRSFAVAGFSEVLKPHDKENTTELTASVLTSSFVENQGDGTFAMRPLPLLCQMAPVYGMLTQDFNEDGNLDIVLSGNQHSAEPVFGNYDASNGICLLGNGEGDFASLSATQSGLFLNGDQKSAVNVLVGATPTLVAGANSGPLKAYQYHNHDTTTTEIVNLTPFDAYADITFRNGRTTRREFYYGSTYLSQSARRLRLSDDMKDVLIYTTKGERRRIR